MTVLIKNSSDAMSYRIEVDDIGNANISSATFAQILAASSPLPAPDLTFGTPTPDNGTTPKSVVVSISGGKHGETYQATGTFTLSAGGTLVRTIVIRMFDS